MLYTSRGPRCYPSAASGVSLTPSGSSMTPSAWVEVIASTPEAWAGHGVVLSPGAAYDGLGFVEIGVGALGAEASIGAMPIRFGNAFASYELTPTLPVPVDLIPAGSRVSVRIAKEGTNTTACSIKLTYYKKSELPAGLALTQQVLKCTAPTDRAGAGTAWVSSAYTTLIASTAAPTTLAGFAYNRATNAEGFEIDFATGAAAAESVVWSAASHPTNSFFSGQPHTVPIWPLRTGIASSTRVAIRCRNSGTSVTAWRFIVAYYENLEAAVLAQVATTQTQTLEPAAADPISLTAVANGSNLGWVELIAATATAIALTFWYAYSPNYPGALDVSTGAPGDEHNHIVDSWLTYSVNERVGARRTYPRLIASGSRVSVRLRQDTSSGSCDLKLGVIASPTFDALAVEAHATIPADASESISDTVPVSTTPWNNGAPVEIAPASYSAIPWALTGFAIAAGIAAEYELDILIGGAVAATIAGASLATYGAGGERMTEFAQPIRVPAATAVEAVLRKSGTNGTNWFVWFEAYGADPASATDEVDADRLVFTLPEAWAGSTGPIYWTTIVGRDADGNVTRYPWAPISIADPANYYAGFKEPRLLSVGQIVFPLSDRFGRYQVPTCEVTYSDLPGADGLMLMRGMLGRDTQKALRGKEYTLYAITDRDRRLRLTPAILFRGYIDRYSGPADYQFTIQSKGWIARRLKAKLWNEVVGDFFPGAPAEARSLSVPIAFGRLSDAGSGTGAPVIVADEAGFGGDVLPPDAWVSGFGEIATAPADPVLTELVSGGAIHAGNYRGQMTRIVAGVESDPAPFLPESGVLITVGADAAIQMTGTPDGADAYRFYLLTPVLGATTTAGSWRGCQWIETTDPATGVIFDDLNVDEGGAGATGATNCVNPFAYGCVLAVMDDGRTIAAPSNFFPLVISLVSIGYLRPVRVAWTPVPDALYYEFYMRGTPTGDWSARFIVPANQLNGDGNVYWQWQWGDATAYEAITRLPTTRGLVPPIFVGGGDGTFVDNDGWGGWYGFLVSARPCVEIESLFLVTGSGDTETVVPVDAGSYSTTWAVPGLGQWAGKFGPELYYAVGDYRLTMIFAFGPDASDIATGAKTLRVNLKGHGKTSDPATVETSIYEQFRMIAKNSLLSDTPAITGDFDQTPRFSDGTQRLNDASVDQAATDALALVSSPFAARWLFGSMTGDEFFQDICPSALMKFGIKLNGQVVVCVHNPDAEPVATIDERKEVLAGSFGFEATDQGFANAAPYAFNPTYDATGALTLQDGDVVEDEVSQSPDQYDERLEDELVSLNWIRRAGSARQIALARLRESACLPQPATAESVLHWHIRKPGDVVAVTHRQGAEATGYTARKHAIVGMTIALQRLTIGLNLLDLRKASSDLSDFLSVLLMGIQELGGSRVDSCLTEAGIVVPVNYRRGIINWDQIPGTHEVVFDVEVATAAGSITPNLYEFGDDTGDSEVCTGTLSSASTLTRQQHVVDRPDEEGVVEYWMLPVLAGGATDVDAKMIGCLRVRVIGSES